MHCLNAVNLAQILYKFNESIINTVLHQDSDGNQRAKDSSSKVPAAATVKVDPSAKSTAVSDGKPAAEGGSKGVPHAGSS